MWSVYKKTDKRPVPPGVTIEHRKIRGESKAHAVYTDRRGRKQAYPLADEDPGKMLVERSHWYIDYTGPDGKTATIRGYTDKQTSERLAQQKELEAEKVRNGERPTCPGLHRARTPFNVVLKEYLADLERAERDDGYRYNADKLLTKLADECSWPMVASMDADSLTTWLSSPARRTKAPKTNNQYIDFAHTFAEWCITNNYLAYNPFSRVEKARITTRKRVFRALTRDEQERLLSRTPSTERRMIYLIALRSGLRRDEINRLCWAHMNLDRQCWLLAAANTKNRRDTALEMNAELAAALRAWKAETAGPLDRVVSHVPKWKTFGADLKKAGIPYYDDQGRQASFHALRKTFGTELALAGVPLVKAMHLMRHSDPKLTARIYCDAGVLDLDGAVNSLRSLGVAVLTLDDLPEEET